MRSRCEIPGDADSNEKTYPQVTFTYDFYIINMKSHLTNATPYVKLMAEVNQETMAGEGDRDRYKRELRMHKSYCNWLNEKEDLPKLLQQRNLLDKDGRITTDPSKVVD